MAEQTKNIKRVEILHLDELGYGPEGKHTRRAWREECLQNLLAGKAQFEAWQQSWRAKIANAPTQSNAFYLHYDDGSKSAALGSNSAPIALDFIGRGFDFIANNFNGPISYTKMHFFINADFRYTKFHNGYANFSNVEFDRFVDFRNAKFEGVADFNQARFAWNVDFSDASFSDVNFDGVKFVKKTHFNDACFNGDASFISVRFYSFTSFWRAKFDGFMDFSYAKFDGLADFSSIKVCGDAIFNDAEFDKAAGFSKAEFLSASKFINVTFKEMSDFENSKLTNVGHFGRARFLGEVPAFRGCQIDRTRLEFSDEKHFPKKCFTEDAIKNISFLKRLSDEHGQTDQALNFNAMELKAKRQYEHHNLTPKNHKESKQLYQLFSWRVWIRALSLLSEKRWFCIFTWLYEYTSDFGRSFVRPIVIFLSINLITVGLCVWSAPEIKVLDVNPQGTNIEISVTRAAVEYSLYRSGNFLDFANADKYTEVINQRLFNSDIEPTGMRIYGFFKGLISAFLLFLFALGLRNKYRIG